MPRLKPPKPRKSGPKPAIGHLRVLLGGRAYLGPGRADLLEGIAETGSIAAAGRRMGMSYGRAWGLVRELNESFGADLVTAARGGAARGGATLTPLGREALRRYRSMQKKSERAIAPDVAALRKKLGR